MLNKISPSEKFHRRLAFALCVSVVLGSCHGKQEPKPQTGEELAKKYCTTCHGFPDPGQLDKQSWMDGVLPNMATRLGIRVYGKNMYINDPTHNKSALTFEEWSLITGYYGRSAPDRLPLATHPDSLVKDWAIFDLLIPETSKTTKALTSMVAFDTADGKIFTGDGDSYRITRWNNRLQPEDSLSLGSPPVNVYFSKDSLTLRPSAIFTTLGTLKANNVAEGRVLKVDPAGKLRAPADTIASALPRPVQSVPADINKDGRTDWVVCAFGREEGALSWFEQLPDDGFKEHTILDMAGALQVITGDYNNDGWTDLMALFGNGDECIRLFLNDRHGGFTNKKILSFPAVYGSSSFQLIDINHDGALDILYTCGDNNDYSPVLKPYHGLYIFTNQGNDLYKQTWFYPVNGCTKAVASDFDQDGDIDIASIAFYADLVHDPGEKFIYFEQDSARHFIPHSPPIENYGRWICMDVNDYDHDGDIDIILGNFSATFVTEKNQPPSWDIHLPYLVLRNKKMGK